MPSTALNYFIQAVRVKLADATKLQIAYAAVAGLVLYLLVRVSTARQT